MRARGEVARTKLQLAREEAEAEVARLESSKSYARHLASSLGVPGPAFAQFDDADTALAWWRELGAPVVVKLDGLHAGKGVAVPATDHETVEAINDAAATGDLDVTGQAWSKSGLEELLAALLELLGLLLEVLRRLVERIPMAAELLQTPDAVARHRQSFVATSLNFLGEVGGPKAHELLHTTYAPKLPRGIR